jgi:hypothetical protein
MHTHCSPNIKELGFHTQQCLAKHFDKTLLTASIKPPVFYESFRENRWFFEFVGNNQDCWFFLTCSLVITKIVGFVDWFFHDNHWFFTGFWGWW